MSPEQVNTDKTIDHRSDIYSLGVTMYYAINGKPPYDANTTSQFDIFSKIVYEPLPELAGSGMLKELIQKACAKDRNARFETCQEWLNCLNMTETVAASSSEKTVVESVKNDKTVVESRGTDKNIIDSALHMEYEAKTTSQIESGRHQATARNVNTYGMAGMILGFISLALLGYLLTEFY